MSIKHIVNPDTVREEGTRTGNEKSYCGYTFKIFDFWLTDFEHAKACIDQGDYTQPCKKCYEKAIPKL